MKRRKKEEREAAANLLQIWLTAFLFEAWTVSQPGEEKKKSGLVSGHLKS